MRIKSEKTVKKAISHNTGVRISALLLCAMMLIPCLSACSKPPEFAELEGRLAELIEASYPINEIFFGSGLPTYERVTDPRSSTKVYQDKENGKNIYYYELTDEVLGTVIAYRSSYLQDFSYVQMLSEPDPSRQPIYENAAGKQYAYAIDYEEKHYDYYYTDSDPADYDYVRSDSQFLSIQQIKEAAEAVYSAEYLKSLYVMLFDGRVLSVEDELISSGARYMEFTDEAGNQMLMQSNVYSPLISERRVYDLSTAVIVKPSNKKYVTISLESYLPSSPDNRMVVKLSLVYQNNNWYLDSGTY